MKLAGKTDVGSVRQENQDDYRAGELPGGAAWGLVCDGMGGARGGREASLSACDVIEHCFLEQYAQCLPGDEESFLKRALISANRFVFQKASRVEELAGMGTTAGIWASIIKMVNAMAVSSPSRAIRFVFTLLPLQSAPGIHLRK